MLDRYLMNKKESNKFPAVMTTQEFLGVPEGTILKFDWASAKYVSVEEEEDIAEDYYYSGYAVAVDPYIVKDNIGTYFTHIEQGPDLDKAPNQIPESKIEVEPVIVYSDEDAKNQLKTREQLDEEKLTDMTEPTFPEYTKKHAFVIDCGCGHRKLLEVVQAPGFNITIMAEDETNGVDLHCSKCGANLKLWFAPDEIEETYEFTKEKSN